MNIRELKERLPEAVERWADARIEDMARGDARLAVASVYMKRAAHNVTALYATRMQEAVDGMALFVADENGDVDADTLMKDAVEMLRAMPRQEWDFSLLHGTVGEGRVEVELPDNALTTLLLGAKKTISIDGDELIEMSACVKKGAE